MRDLQLAIADSHAHVELGPALPTVWGTLPQLQQVASLDNPLETLKPLADDASQFDTDTRHDIARTLRREATSMVAKKPGEMVRNCARGSSSPAA